jgi:hypothetical protein
MQRIRSHERHLKHPCNRPLFLPLYRLYASETRVGGQGLGLIQPQLLDRYLHDQIPAAYLGHSVCNGHTTAKDQITSQVYTYQHALACN